MKIFSLDNDNKYSIISRFFHWFRFLLLLAIYTGAYASLFDHRTLGIVMLVFILANIFWRMLNKAPKSFAGSNFEENIEKIVHNGMYVLIVALPILGYLSTMSSVNFGLFQLPSIYSFTWFSAYLVDAFGVDIFTLRFLVGYIHKFITTVLLCLAGLHVFVIVFNRIFRKTGELKRMM